MVSAASTLTATFENKNVRGHTESKRPDTHHAVANCYLLTQIKGGKREQLVKTGRCEANSKQMLKTAHNDIGKCIHTQAQSTEGVKTHPIE